jgi:glutaminyl-peptide cyclotransferase
MRRLSWQAGLVLLVLLAAGAALLFAWPFPNRRQADRTEREIPFNGERAYGYLKDLCAIGPRPSGSPGMKKQQELLARHFTSLGGEVSWQTFAHKAYPGVEFANLIVQWDKSAKRRVLLAAHYDTRPFPDRDRNNPRGTFVGANDGASGVALLMELAHEMRELKAPLGVDFVLFDAEEYLLHKDDQYPRDSEYFPYFLGSEYFARRYAGDAKREFEYVWGVVVDMVGDADLLIYREVNSVASARRLVNDIWNTAKRLGVSEFRSLARTDVRDDHLPLNDIAKIPTCDIIDFDFPHWHTEADTPDKCSAASLAKVGWVVREWLKTAK